MTADVIDLFTRMKQREQAQQQLDNLDEEIKRLARKALAQLEEEDSDN